eukprot:4280378-Ditylum_brightwellii.AAC.1
MRAVDSPFMYLQADDDVQQAVEATFQETNSCIQSKHVKGQQDDSKKYSLKELMNKKSNKELPWGAKLNIIVDKLGHIAQNQMLEHKKTNFMLLPAGK